MVGEYIEIIIIGSSRETKAKMYFSLIPVRYNLLTPFASINLEPIF